MKNKLICLAVALATVLFMTACGGSPQTTENVATEFEAYIMGQFVQSDMGTMLEAQSPQKVKVGGKTVETNAFVIQQRFDDQFYSCPVVVKTTHATLSGDNVVLDIEFFVKDDICIPTQYGLLHFSDEWVDYLDLVTIDDDKTFVFRYKNGDESLDLFSISFDVRGDMVLGSVDNGNTTVLVEIFDNSGSKNDAVFAMADGINYLAEKIESLEGFQFS